MSRSCHHLIAFIGVSLCLLLTVSVAHAADRGDSAVDSTHLRLGPRGEPVVEARVDGRRVRMMIDTGSTHTSLSIELGRDLGLRWMAKAPVQTSIGEIMQPIARLGQLTLAGRSSEQLLVSLLPAEVLDPTGDIQGIVGQDVLADGIYTLDFGRRRLSWHRDPPDPGVAALELELEAGRFVARVEHLGRTLRFVPDSGAEALVLYGATGLHERATTRAILETVSGLQSAPLALIPRLAVGDVMLRNVRAAILPRRAEAPTLDGLLPLSLFDRVTVDGPGRRLYLAR